MKFVLSVVFFICANAYALTWDEPWQKDVVKEADSFGLYTVVKNKGDSLKLKLVKHISGEKFKPEITVSSFYLFKVTSSSSGHKDPIFFYKPGQKVYFYLKKTKNGFQVASPTAGSDEILKSGNVAASFRISIHKTEIDTKTYEAAQSCIFLYLHNGSCTNEVVNEIIENPLRERVAVLSEAASQKDVELFFKQHVALETSYLINHQNSHETLMPFLNSKFFHVQMSAIRALSVTNSGSKVSQIIKFITKSDASDMAKVMAVVMLNELNLQSGFDELKNYLPLASKEEVSLVSNIMDSRVGTRFPDSVQAAMQWFLESRANSAIN
jgi:hypothetical protein